MKMDCKISLKWIRIGAEEKESVKQHAKDKMLNERVKGQPLST